MLLRLRTRDGTERITVDNSASVEQLMYKIEENLKVPIADQTLSLQQQLLMSKTSAAFTDMRDPRKSLRELGIENGTLVYLKYGFEREVTSQPKKEERAWGAHMTMNELILKQTRIEPQEKPHCVSCSFDGNAANVFQSYVRDELSFCVQRAGFLYGECSEEGLVKIHFIYEPPQENAQDKVILMRNEYEERSVDLLASTFGWKRVGIVLTHSSDPDREFNLCESQLRIISQMQAEHGEHFVTALLSIMETEEGTPETHFEAFQLSDQCIELYNKGLFPSDEELEAMTKASEAEKDSEPIDPGFTRLKKEVIVAGRDVKSVDNDFLLVAVPILDHSGPVSCLFPVENRMISQTTDDLKNYLLKNASKTYLEKLSDFHILLYLMKQSDILDQGDMLLLLDAVKNKQPIQEGYVMLIEGIARMQ